MSKTLVLYHANCYDGFGAAWAAWRKLGDSADYRPVQYGAGLPNVEEYDTIYVLDFSYPREILDRWIGQGEFSLGGRTVRVIDHHKTAEETLKDFSGAIFDMNHSGAYLAWRYFHKSSEVPELVQYVEDRDLWRWKLQYSREINAAISSYPMKFDTWGWLYQRLERPSQKQVPTVAVEGEAILRYKRQQIEMICDQAEWLNLGEHRIVAVNATSQWSEVCEELLKLYPESPFAATYYYTHGKIKWSLRSRGDFDVSEIAKQYGGGGHKAAAGFEEKL